MKKIIIIIFIIFIIVCSTTDTEIPVVSIVRPTNNSVTYDDSLYVQVVASDNRGIEKVEIYVNDTLIKTFTRRPFECYILTQDYQDSTILNIFACAFDYSKNIGFSDTVRTIIIKNFRPIVSKPFGNLPDEGIINTPYTFKAYAVDQDDDSIYIRFYFGNGDTSLWSNLIKCGDTIEITHTFTEPDEYLISAQAKDKRGKHSYWSNPLKFIIREN